MSDDADDRTLPASARRRSEAIASGHVPRSSQVGTAAMLAAVSAYGAYAGGDLIIDAAGWLRSRWLSVEGSADVAATLVDHMRDSLWAGVGLVGGLILLVFSTVVVAELLQNGMQLRVDRAAPDAARLGSGVSRIGRGLSPASMAGELLGWGLPLALFAGLVSSRWPSLADLMHAPPGEIPERAGGLLSSLLTRLGVALVVLAGLHYLWLRWRWEQSLQMTVAEQREEQSRDRRRVPPHLGA